MRADAGRGQLVSGQPRHPRRHGPIVDATIVHAPSSTKNAKKERDSEMHQTKKGNQWYFGMKAHIGVDAKKSVVHSVNSSAARLHISVHSVAQDSSQDRCKKSWVQRP